MVFEALWYLTILPDKDRNFRSPADEKPRGKSLQNSGGDGFLRAGSGKRGRLPKIFPPPVTPSNFLLLTAKTSETGDTSAKNIKNSCPFFWIDIYFLYFCTRVSLIRPAPTESPRRGIEQGYVVVAVRYNQLTFFYALTEPSSRFRFFVFSPPPFRLNVFRQKKAATHLK